MSATAGEPILVRVDPDLEPLVPGYLEKRRADVPRLRHALAAGDMDTLETIGHIMKGSGGAYGFERLTELGGELESAAADGDAARAAGPVEAIADYLGRVEVEYG